MSDPVSAAWRRALVLGGIRSGKSELAEDLVSGAARVRYVATARRGDGDGDWETRIDAHRARRPDHWSTDELGAAPHRLAGVLEAADAAEAVLVDDLGGWVGAVTEVTAAADWPMAAADLALAVTRCRARLVLVSPEVGLSVIPPTASGRQFADALGGLNRTIAAACDVVVLVVAGNAVPVKGRL